MKDKLFELYSECPKCGEKRKLYYSMQYTLSVKVNLNGKVFIEKDDKRLYNISNRQKAHIFNNSLFDFQVANCCCEKCGWISEPITQ
ncbi:MAG: hypothetical protein IJ716_11620 [Lachnospiraceae bacterium]|nr:hypothetical protein [Lachnospiraceae bacterium]